MPNTLKMETRMTELRRARMVPELLVADLSRSLAFWYRSDAIEVGVRQFLVQDPDGYLLRFSAWVGDRPAAH